MKNRKLIFLYTIMIAFGITLAGCDSEITSSSDEQESIQPDSSFVLFDLFTCDEDQNCEEADGELVFLRNKSNNTFSWQLKTSAFDAGHAYTVWIGNFDENGLGNNGGWGAGWIVDVNGQFTAAGDHCVWPLDQDDPSGLSGGFRPGTPPDCNMVDTTEPIWFYVLDHGDWEPGDMLALWDPTSGTGDPGVLEGILFSFIPPVE
jgi:hypothetical protein